MTETGSPRDPARKRPGFWRASLTARLVSAYLLLSCLSVILVAGAAFLVGKEALRGQALERLQSVAAQKEKSLDQWVRDREADLQFLARDLLRNHHLPEDLPTLKQDPATLPQWRHLSAFFSEITAVKPDMAEVLLLSPGGGRVLASSSPSSVGQFRTTYNFYLRGREQMSLQSTYPSTDSLQPVMTLSMPLRDKTGRLRGVLAVHLNLERLDALIRDRAGLGATGETYLVDSFHAFVSSDPAIRTTPLRGVHTVGIDAALGGRNGSGLYKDFVGTDVVGVYRWLPQYRMALLAEMSQEEAFGPARRLTGLLVTVGALAALFLALGVRWLSRRMARPVLAVTEAARRVAAGDLTVRAPVLAEDELGTLARAFNKMTEDLQGLYGRLNQQIRERTAILQHSHDGIAVAGKNGVIRFVSPGMERILRHPASDVPNIRALVDLALPGQAERQAAMLDWSSDIENPEPPERVFRIEAGDGSRRWVRILVSHMNGDEVILNAQDITEMKAGEERIRHLALHDPLTGLPNRQLFADRLEQALKVSRRGRHLTALLYLDLDRFKAMNDTHGHQFGDEVLREAARRLKACVRDTDTVARIGGDEFTVVLPDLSEPADAARLAEKIGEALFQPELPGGLYLAGASIGVALAPDDGQDQDALMAAADRAMYVAKRRGGNGFAFFSAPERG